MLACLLLLLLLMLMLIPILMKLALALLLLPHAFKAAAYVVVDDVDAETKMLNVARHLASANDVLLLLMLVMLVMLMIL